MKVIGKVTEKIKGVKVEFDRYDWNPWSDKHEYDPKEFLDMDLTKVCSEDLRAIHYYGYWYSRIVMDFGDYTEEKRILDQQWEETYKKVKEILDNRGVYCPKRYCSWCLEPDCYCD